jgi:transglutaminase-like putative cysteine protease
MFVQLPSLVIQLEGCKQQYLTIMKILSQNETESRLRALFDRFYNYAELLRWEHERLNYSYDPNMIRNSDPFQILQYGKGRCEEFSILYVAICLANGYQARFVLDVYGDHTWSEISLQGSWVHVDPTEKRINDPLMYERDWHKNEVLVYALEDGFCEDVTSKYTMTMKQDYFLIV